MYKQGSVGCMLFAFVLLSLFMPRPKEPQETVKSVYMPIPGRFQQIVIQFKLTYSTTVVSFGLAFLIL